MTGDQREPGEGRWGPGRTSLVVVLVLALVGGGLWLAGQRDVRREVTAPPVAPTTVVEPSPTVDPSVLRLQALDALMAARSAAIRQRDRQSWLATVDPGSEEFAARQAAVFDNLAEVPLAEWRYEYAGDGPSLPAQRLAELGPDAWVARAVLVYRLEGPETGEVRREQYLTLVRRGEQWLVADDTDGGTSPDLWDLGPVQVSRGERSLALGTAPEADLQRYAEETDHAATHVDTVWGTEWPRTVVVMVPATQEEMARLLLRPDDAGLEQIAAVTTGEVGLDQAGTSADRVIINPAGFAQLGPLGRRVVLAHEITHVATRATTAEAVPIWLSEGFADYVAYAGTGVSTAVIAQDVLDRVRSGDGPVALPTSVDFDPRRGDIAPAYSGSWLAARLVAERWGEDALVALYRSVASGTPTSQALPEVLGVDEQTLTQEWLAYLEELAS
ncbi:MAG: peptidase MA family metallohydrolase [Actinomycetes bacterium]